MNAISTTTQHPSYTLPQRRANGVVGINRARPDAPAQQHQVHIAEAALQGEVVDREQAQAQLRVRGGMLEGRSSTARNAVAAYQLHQTISPSTVSTPGRLLDALA